MSDNERNGNKRAGRWIEVGDGEKIWVGDDARMVVDSLAKSIAEVNGRLDLSDSCIIVFSLQAWTSAITRLCIESVKDEPGEMTKSFVEALGSIDRTAEQIRNLLEPMVVGLKRGPDMTMRGDPPPSPKPSPKPLA